MMLTGVPEHAAAIAGLRQVSTFYRQIRSGLLERSQFPNTLEDENGAITKPDAWGVEPSSCHFRLDIGT